MSGRPMSVTSRPSLGHQGFCPLVLILQAALHFTWKSQTFFDQTSVTSLLESKQNPPWSLKTVKFAVGFCMRKPSCCARAMAAERSMQI